MTTDTTSRFSIVVPITDDDGSFDQTLASLLRDLESGTEVILVHDGTYEDPHSLAGEVKIVDAGSRRISTMLHHGVSEATREFVAVVRPGIELPENWQTVIEPKFADEKVASVAPIIVSGPEPDCIVTAGLRTNYGFQRILEGDGEKTAKRVFARLRPVGPTQWAAFYRRSTLELAGNFDASIDDQFVDLDVAVTLKNLGYRCELVTNCVAKISRPMLITQQADRPHGLASQRAIVRHGKGDSPIGRGLIVIAKELVSIPFQPSLLMQALGRLAGLRTLPQDQKFAQRVAKINRMKSSIEKTGLKVFASDLTAELQKQTDDDALNRAA